MDCKTCNGSGYFYRETAFSLTCPACSGSGVAKKAAPDTCYKCLGYGEYIQFDHDSDSKIVKTCRCPRGRNRGPVTVGGPIW